MEKTSDAAEKETGFSDSKKVFRLKSRLPDIFYKPYVFPLIGSIVVLLSFVPAFLLGSGSAVILHDQLDGEVFTYILRARHPGASAFAEFMNGQASTSLMLASPGTTLFYFLLPPFWAFLANEVFVALTAFTGMYLCLRQLVRRRWIAWIVAVLFSLLPFYSVYGLSVMGQPLLVYACLRILKGKKPWVSCVLAGVFGLFSSLVLVGYADCLLLLAAAIALSFRRHPSVRWFWLLLGILTCVYLVLNSNLLGQMLFSVGDITHKSEMVAQYDPAKACFQELLTQGMYHAEALHTDLLPWCCAVLGGVFIAYGWLSKSLRRRAWMLGSLLGMAVFIAGFYAFWRWKPVVEIRNDIGGFLTSFQADRFYWLYPCIWYLIFGFVLYFITVFFVPKAHRVTKIACGALTAVLLLTMGSTIFDHSGFKKNLVRLTEPETTASFENVSWDEFFSPGLFEDIKGYIGREPSSYRVASVALYPSVPLYNGFYCIDGYSNNYNVDYKHAFREIIAPELEKSEELRTYYDNWGSRCYLFSSELGKNYFFTKDSSKVLEDLTLSHEGLKNMGCDYILSGLQIGSPEQSGLVFLKSFENEESPYRIYLYQVQ